MAPMARDPPPSAAPSSSTLWATASKEWILPAKPKPGRKPKKDSQPPPEPSPDEPEQLDAKGRRVQNRAAQRAFRERKQNQLADLQARVQQYEQGEIEKNVALQNVSKRLKEENDQLKLENGRLLAELEAMRAKYTQGRDKKRVREDDFPPGTSDNPIDNNPPRKRFRGLDALVNNLLSVPSPISTSLISSPSPLASSPDSCGSVQTAVSPLSYATPGSSSYLSGSEPSHLPTPNSKTIDYSAALLDTIVDCGFCSEDTPCVCREIALQQATASGFANRDQVKRDMLLSLREEESRRDRLSLTTSILDNLPAFQPPVPLPKRTSVRSQSIFPVVPIRNNEPPTCSGDPSNCSACADDPFGKAFCAALDDAVPCKGPCCSQPRRGNDTVRASQPPLMRHDSYNPPPPPTPPPPNQQETEIVPRADVWRQLKSHPNAPFADLRLLAEVVARSTACAGPSCDVSPSSNSSEPLQLQQQQSENVPHKVEDEEEIILTDPHARYHELRAAQSFALQDPNPSLVPQDVLMKCGRDRILSVRAEGVRDALRLLDSRFSP